MGNLLYSEGMTMRSFLFAALATTCLLAVGSVGWATDTVRLGGPSTKIEGTTDSVHWRHHHRGYYGGGYYGGGYYRPYYSSSYYYRPSYYPRSYAYYPSYYYPTYYPASYYPSYYYPSTYYYYPIAGETTPPPATTVQGAGSYYQAPRPQQYVPPMPPPDANGTYQYDGGPRSVVPMPSFEPNPSTPPRILPVDGRLVSLPTKMSGSTGASDIPATQKSSTNVPRVHYPAYGDEPITPAPRTNR